VIDGDTIELRNGKRVRLVQIDAPELGQGECYGRESSAVLAEILPRGARITLEADPGLDQVDRDGRLLRYVFKGDQNVNLLLARHGGASVWFFQGERGRYAKQLLRATKRAKSAGRGLWGACPGTKLTPEQAIETSSGETAPAAEPPPTTEAPATTEQATSCDPSYPTLCLDPTVSDYDCAGGSGNGPEYVQETDFPVRPPDPFGLDGNDNDGVGCES
jgi:endonuclease YncB( thermonuclease family)